MLTLTLIFYGLVAFVPSINGEGAMVVFPSAENVVDSRGCTITTHAPRIFQVLYSPGGKKPMELKPMFVDRKGLPSYIEPENVPSRGLRTASGLRAIGSNGAELVFPSNSGQVADLSWIPNLSRLSFASGDIRAECLIRPSECKIPLSVRTWQGDAHVCHLAHPNEGTGTGKGKLHCGTEGPVLAYRFKDLGAPSTSQDALQAVADAFMIRMTLEKTPAASMYLLWTDGSEKHETIEYGDDTNITLLFANLPGDSKNPHGRCHSTGIDRHFYSYYDLGTTDPKFLTSLPLPQSTSEEAPGGFEMECEGEVSLLESRLTSDYRALKRDDDICPDAKPHSIEVCSTAQFFAAVLPSFRSQPPQRTAPVNNPAAFDAARDPVRSGPIRLAPVAPTAVRPSRTVDTVATPVTSTPSAQSATVPPG